MRKTRNDIPALVRQAREGDPRAVARLITLVENSGARVSTRGNSASVSARGNSRLGDDEVAREIAVELAPHTGRAPVIGLTGSPGVGKSTTTTALVAAYRAAGKRVGVLAVDPSSPFTGGAILGDRVRMQEHATDPGVYIRSMSSRGHLGGLASATPQAVRVLEGAGCDVIIVETVGVGQAEVEVASLADTTLVLLAPGMGDAIQAVKAGILEIADIFVVNKADRDGIESTLRDIRGMIALSAPGPGDWRPKVLKTIAVKGEGIDEVLTAIDQHREWLIEHGELARRRRVRAEAEVEALALATLRGRLGDVHGESALGELAAKVAEGALDPFTAADTLLAGL